MKTVEMCKRSPAWPKFEEAFVNKVGRIEVQDARTVVICFHWFELGFTIRGSIHDEIQLEAPASVRDFGKLLNEATRVGVPPVEDDDPGTPPDLR